MHNNFQNKLPGLVEGVIMSTLQASKWAEKEETRKAYMDAASMIYDFLSHNPHLVKSEDAEKFYDMCLFPSVINFSDGD